MDTTNEKHQEINGLQANETDHLPARVETVIDASAVKLIEILQDNITKIQDNPGYIPQAQAVADQVDKIIQIGKTQIEAMRVASSMMKK